MVIYAKKLISTLKPGEESILKKIIDYDRILDNQCIDSYNQFVDYIKQFYEGRSVLVYKREDNNLVTEYYLEFTKFYIDRPSLTYANGESIRLTADIAELKNANYFSDIYADLKLISVKEDGVKKVELFVKNKKIGGIPIMIGSKLDTVIENKNIKGYFILRGVEKIILAIEEIVDNTPITVADDKVVETYIYSKYKGLKYVNKLTKSKNSNLLFRFQPLNFAICPFTLLKVLGYTDLDIINKCAPDDEPYTMLTLCSWLEASTKDKSKEELEQSIKLQLNLKEDTNVLEKTNHTIQNYVLMFLGPEKENIKTKMDYLCSMIKTLLKQVIYNSELTVIDNLEFKKIRLTGYLLEELFLYYHNKQIENFKIGLLKHIHNKSLNLLNLFRADILTNSFITHIVSGTWVGNRQDITTSLDRNNPYTYYSVIRKVTSVLSKIQLHYNARGISRGFRGRIDPVDCGHGNVVGLVKSIALGAYITSGQENFVMPLKKFKTGLIPVLYEKKILFHTDSVENFISTFRMLRFKGTIPIDLNYSLNNNCIDIRNSNGRLSRILWTKSAKKISLEVLATFSLEELRMKGYIEWLDPEEEYMYSIAISLNELEQEAYAEIHPVLLFNLSAASIPFMNHTGPARISYGQKLFKQAIVPGYKKNSYKPIKKSLHTVYSQKPLVSSVIQPLLNELMPNEQPGVNITVAIMAHDGYNLEDACIFNKASVQRGLFFAQSSTLTMAESEIIETSNTNTIFKLPSTTKKLREDSAYDTLDEDGTPALNTIITPGKAIVSNVSLPKYVDVSKLTMNKPIYNDLTVFNNSEIPNCITKVHFTKNNNLNSLAYVESYTEKPMNLGDKLSSRFAQKGIIGKLIEPWNMFYDKNTGIAPDIVIPGSAYPTRYIIGHLYEILVAKACAELGKYADDFFSTSFEKLEDVCNYLERKGLCKYSTVEYVDPKTGLSYKSKVFTGVSYYLRLHHLASEKLHIRSTGPVQLLTRQATAGKLQGGGLRLGEMQRDCLATFGAANLLLERLSIDLIEYLICNNCFEFVDIIYGKSIICKVCNTNLYIQRIKLPHAFKLLIDQLAALHIKIKIVMDKYE
jgi:DNA-directed RNA polymerase subunit B